MNSRDGILRFARRIARRAARYALAQEPLLQSRALQRVLAFQADEGVITDLNLCVPITYESNSVLGTLLFYRGSFEEEEIVFLLRLVKDVSSPVLLDIGANIGWHAVRWATSRPDICIFAFEPSRNTAELLRRNVIVNGVEAQIRHIPSAVSDTIGALEFHECEDSGYSSLKDTKRKKVIATTTVPVTTVDSFVKDERLSHVAAIKIDVEGLETEVLRGATDTLSRWSPEMLVEIYGGQASNPNPDKTIRLMQSLGYRAFVWKNKKLLPFESHSDRYFNYWFTKRQNPPTSLG